MAQWSSLAAATGLNALTAFTGHDRDLATSYILHYTSIIMAGNGVMKQMGILVYGC